MTSQGYTNLAMFVLRQYSYGFDSLRGDVNSTVQVPLVLEFSEKLPWEISVCLSTSQSHLFIPQTLTLLGTSS